jgi:ABC-type nitrate/sulfonate/bicarbonate transport system substrate-binding protein
MHKVICHLIAFVLMLCTTEFLSSQELTKLPFPYGPLGLNSIPWVVAKERRFFEKNGLDVDMVYVGASAVIVQSMLSGSANIAGFGGPAVITNVLRGGDIIQVAAMAPFLHNPCWLGRTFAISKISKVKMSASPGLAPLLTSRLER